MKTKLNVLYLISCFKPTGGGHYYSLKTISDELNKVIDVNIASIGPSISNIFKYEKNYYSLKSNWPSLFIVYNIIKIIKYNRINIIHSFDHTSYFFARVASILTGKGIVHTKCGGAPPVRYHPEVQDLILFSKEDVNYFKSNYRKNNYNIYHIPNRAKKVKQDKFTIKKIKDRFKKDSIIILRIARFSKTHKKSIFDTIKLHHKLNKNGFKTQLILIGTVEDKRIFEEVKSMKTDNILLLTEEIYTLNASRLLEVSDIVVGTGRSAMEAAFHSKILLAPVKNASIPILVNQKNIDRLLDFNFSHRSFVSNLDELVEFKKIKILLNDNNKIEKHKNFLRQYSKDNFDISSKIQDYINIYSSSKKCKFLFTDLIFHFYLVAKRFFIFRFFKVL